MLSPYQIELREKKLGLKEPENKKPKRIAQYSKRREKKQEQYRKLVKEMLDENNRCEIKSPECTGRAQGMQHIEKRSEKNLLERKNLLRSCNACNNWIERNPLEAIKIGVSKSKHIKP